MLLFLSSKKLFLVRNKELMAFPVVTLNQEIFKDNLIQDNWESGWGYYLTVLLCWDYLLSNEKSVLMRYSWTGEWVLVKYLWGHQVLARWKSWKEARTDDLKRDVLIKKKVMCFALIQSYPFDHTWPKFRVTDSSEATPWCQDLHCVIIVLAMLFVYWLCPVYLLKST